ncbi:hypothetical protein B9Z55_018800 [Caenorhabditis nigoni]|uniref:C6 domain-containing protein n=1 Tax=Caenorhabditis nigoni TaxID=1611254 RepID=A0A2G5TFU4_9PELO|nr:hypothetical protein B9Z55_018800 [Caenorhabditis nigoni]
MEPSTTTTEPSTTTTEPSTTTTEPSTTTTEPSTTTTEPSTPTTEPPTRTTEPSTTTTEPPTTTTVPTTTTTEPSTTTTEPSTTTTEPSTTTTEPPTTTTEPSTTTTEPSTTTTVPSTTTAEPSTTTTVLNACSPTLVDLDTGDNNNPQINVEVTYSGYSFTPISGSSETMSTMIIRCSAINNYNVFMQFNVNEGGPLVEQFLPQTIAVNVTCNSADQVWIYAAEVSGVVHTRDVRSVACQQAPNAG